MSPVALIIPPSAFLADERVFVSLGALKVAGAIEARGGAVEVLDLSGIANYEEAITDCLSRTAARAIGITATTPQMPAVTRIVARIREAGAYRVIIGGPHPTLVHASMARGRRRALRAWNQLRSMADVIVAGDGEEAIEVALAPEPPSVVNADDPKAPWFLSSAQLDKSPWPARHLVDLASYQYTIDEEPATSLIAQLGCPFGCNFCGGRYSPVLRRVRMRSTDSILREIEHLRSAYGYRGIMFYDDELNVSRTMLELMRGLAARQERTGEALRLRGFIKAELFTEEQARAMYEAGFRWILTGFESGSPRILRNIEKRASVEDNDRCMGLARGAGLKVKALMSIGHAGETEETVAETRAWLLRVQPDDFDCTVITPYPGAPYYDDASEDDGIWSFSTKSGDRLYSHEVDYSTTAEFYKGVPGDYVSHVWTDALTAPDLVRLRDELEAEVRSRLGLPHNTCRAAIRYEHSMGQSGPLPSSLYRKSQAPAVSA